YTELLIQISKQLQYDLTRINNESNWSPEIYVSLDSEVEVRTGATKKRRITDLLSAIRSDSDSKIFLVLGDPGSGKSVALRKLCHDMHNEVKKTGKLPLYINLREWHPETKWTPENPPTDEQLYDFVLRNLKSRLDVFGNE